MPKEQTGYKGSLVKRLTKDSLDYLGKYSSDCNEAVQLIAAEMESLRAARGSSTNEKPSTCRVGDKQFETQLRSIIKEAMEEVLQPFVGK